MGHLKFIAEYPVTWLVFLSILTLLFFLKNYKTMSLLSGALILPLAVSITPLGSSIWLNSLTKIDSTGSESCAGSNIDSAILLPGGVVYVGGKPTLTRWSKERVGAVNEYIHEGKIKEVLIPGGAVTNNKNEASYLVDSLSSNMLKPIRVISGPGSNSTYGNFIELQAMIDRRKTYYLFTSRWHLYRALKVAEKIGIKICPVKIVATNKSLEINEHPWLFKAAIREYLAISFYFLKGRI